MAPSTSFAHAQEALALAVEGFRRRLAGVGDPDWSRPTPCEGWAVADLVKHLVGGGIMSELLLNGASKEDAFQALFSLELDGDLHAAFEDACQRQSAVFARPGAADSLCHHPLRDMPASEFIWLRVRDTLVHTWDLARAVGADEHLNAGLVDEVWGQVAPAADRLAASGMFGAGPSGHLEPTATNQDRLLDALGRRP